MTTATTPADTPSPDAAPLRPRGWARPLMEADLAVLARLRDAGVALAEAVAARAQAPAPAESDETPPPASPFGSDLVLAFARVSRAVRMTCALRARLIDDIERLDYLQVARAGARLDNDREERKDHIARVLTRIMADEAADQSAKALAKAEAEADDGESVESVEGWESESETFERLVDEANERLDDRDRFGDVLARPVSEFIDIVCRDLGLAPDWRRLAQEAWAQEEIASGWVGEPLAPFSSPACGGGGPRSGGGGATASEPESAPSVTALARRATFPASEEGEGPPPTVASPPLSPPGAPAPAPA